MTFFQKSVPEIVLFLKILGAAMDFSRTRTFSEKQRYFLLKKNCKTFRALGHFRIMQPCMKTGGALSTARSRPSEHA